MTTVRVVHDIRQYAELRHDPKVQKLCERLAAELAATANARAITLGARYESQPASLPYRGGASVHPANHKGRIDNARNNTLLTALGSAGGPP